VFGPYRKTRKVSVFGSARTQPHETVYKMARRLGRILGEAGYMVITGGGPGIMQAVNEGAGPEMSFGVNIRLPFEQRMNPILDGNPRSITYKYFFNRKVAFLKETDAVVLFREASELWTKLGNAHAGADRKEILANSSD
jgi:predicted Rossmann-fold nucleotide-binding protein